MKLRLLSMLPLLAAVMLPGSAVGAAIYDISVDTSSLMGSPLGPFTMAFQLTDGSGTGDGNNTVTIDNFDFGSGGPTGSPTLSVGASGDTATSVVLTDTEFFNEFNQGFTPGNLLSFYVALTLNPDSIDVPDEFSFAILDGSLAGAPLLIADIDPKNFALIGFGSDTPSIPEPTITPIPEPSTVWLASGAFGLFVGFRTRLAAIRS